MALVNNNTTTEVTLRPFIRPVDPRVIRTYAPRGIAWAIAAPTIAAQDAADQTNITVTTTFDRNFCYRIQTLSVCMRSSTATNGIKNEAQVEIQNYTDTTYTNFTASLFIPLSSVQTRDSNQATDQVYYPNRKIQMPLRARAGSAVSVKLTMTNVDTSAQPAMTLDYVLAAYYYDLAQYDDVVMHTTIPTLD